MPFRVSFTAQPYSCTLAFCQQRLQIANLLLDFIVKKVS